MKIDVTKPAVTKPVRRLFFAAASIVVVLTATQALGQDSWQPFRERDERAAIERERSRRHAPVEAQPAEAVAAPAAQPAFTPPPTGTVERVELAPLDPVQGQPDATPPSPPSAMPPSPRVGVPPTLAMPGLLPPPDQSIPTAPAQRSGFGTPQSHARAQGLPADLWRGIDLQALEALIQPLEVPPRSAALNALWQRLFLADVTPPQGGKGAAHYTALRLEVMYRSGLIEAMKVNLSKAGEIEDPLLTAFRMRRDLAASNSDAACAGARALTAHRQSLPRALVGEAHILTGYCAALGGNRSAAGLAAELAREEEIEAPLALQALDAIAGPPGAPRARIALPKRLTVLDYRLLELAGPLDPVQVLNSAEPALLYALSQSTDTAPKLAIAAAEAAAALHVLAPEQLIDVYKRVDSGSGTDPLLRRAAGFKQIVTEQDPVRKLTLARQMIDDARRSGLAYTLARALAVELASIQPSGDLGAAATTAAELAVAGGDYARARRFAAASPQAALWAPLAELADPAMRGVTESALAVLDDAVRRQRFQPDQLHRIAVVLDALDTNVPIPLWEAASRTAQPTSGYLPETGTLPKLRDAAGKREVGHTALLVLRSIGPQGPDATNLIALGEALRALRRAGLEADARLFAMEALFAGWPRG